MKNQSNPQLIDVLKELKSDIFYSFNCHKVGIIQSFNSETQTATISLIDKRIISTYEGTELKPYQLLVDCPVYIVGGGDGWIDQPFSVGDNCLVLFNDRDIDNWFTSGITSAAPTPRAHSLADGIALIGLHNLTNNIVGFDNTSLGFRYKGAKVRIADDGKIDLVNASFSLKTLIDNLITTIKALQVVDPVSGNLSITPATSTALDDLKAQFESLLK